MSGGFRNSGDKARSFELVKERSATMRQMIRHGGRPAPLALSMGALAAGAVAFGALAIGALAIGRLAVGRMAIGRARIRQLEIDELTVRRLRVLEPQTGAPDETERQVTAAAD